MHIFHHTFFVCCLGLLFSCGDQKAATDKVIAESPKPDFDISEAKPPPTNVYANKPQNSTETSSDELEIKNESSEVKPKIESNKKLIPKAKPRKKKLPKITYDSLVYHLPDVIEGDILHHDIHFTNTGDAPLSISYVKPSCGCTQPSFPFLDIEPGETGIIGVDYHSVGKSGPQMAELTVTTNAIPKISIVTLEVNVLDKPEE